MVIHFSILGVIIVVSLLYNRNCLKNKLNNEKYQMPIMPWLLIFGYIAFLAAMRSGMNDTSVYVYDFELAEGTINAAVNSWKTLDIKYKLYFTLQNLFKFFVSDDYHIWFLFLAAIQSFCFIKVFRKNCYGIFIPCYYFFTSSLYYNYFSMLRQWTAVAIAFYGFEFFKEKKWGKYVVCSLIAFLFHPSAIVCVAYVFLSTGRPWKKRQSLILLGATISLFLLNPILNTLSIFAEDTTYDYAISALQSNTGSSPVRIIIAAIPVALAFYYRESIDKDNNKTIDMCVNFAILKLLATIVATLTNGLYVTRLASYLGPYTVILYSYILNKTIKGKDRKIIISIFVVAYFLYYCYAMTHQGAWGYRSDILGTFSY